MIVIVNIDDNKFSVNGISYWKTFLPHVVGNKVRIVNLFDTKFELAPATAYGDFTVNGAFYASAEALQAALLPVLYNRASGGGGETGEGIPCVKFRLVSSGSGVISTTEQFNNTGKDFAVSGNVQFFKIEMSEGGTPVEMDGEKTHIQVTGSPASEDEHCPYLVKLIDGQFFFQEDANYPSPGNFFEMYITIEIIP